MSDLMRLLAITALQMKAFESLSTLSQDVVKLFPLISQITRTQEQLSRDSSVVTKILLLIFNENRTSTTTIR